MMSESYKEHALNWLRRELASFQGTFEEKLLSFRSDGRLGSVPGSAQLYCSSGNLYSTTPSDPSVSVLVKTLERNKTLAAFPLHALAAELQREAAVHNPGVASPA